MSEQAIMYADLGLAGGLSVGILLSLCLGILTVRMVQI